MADLSRSVALLGAEAMDALARANVAVVGVGGVGGWCAEALARTGVGHLTLFDDDTVAPSNANRQCAATASTIGLQKTQAMRERLNAVNPETRIEANFMRWPADPECAPDISRFDCIVDAIDSVDCKASLVLSAIDARVPVVSSMGAALRLDPTKVQVRRFDKVEGDGLARALRRRLRAAGRLAEAKFPCVCSTELPTNVADAGVKGSLMPVVCAFGMALAAETISILIRGRDRFLV